MTEKTGTQLWRG